MKAEIGDEIVVDGLHLGELPREGEIIAIKESTGTLLYDVRWDDGHESTFCPGATSHFVRLRDREPAANHRE